MAKILLVEDDNNLREIYEARLQAEGYTVLSSHDGEEALVVAKNSFPDLIISDVMMPKISGFEMLDILRNTEGLQKVKVIMLTALGRSEDQAKANTLGADKYLVKSQVTLEDIVKAVKELIGEETSEDANINSVPTPGATSSSLKTDSPSQPTNPTQPESSLDSTQAASSLLSTEPQLTSAPSQDISFTGPSSSDQNQTSNDNLLDDAMDQISKDSDTNPASMTSNDLTTAPQAINTEDSNNNAVDLSGQVGEAQEEQAVEAKIENFIDQTNESGLSENNVAIEPENTTVAVDQLNSSEPTPVTINPIIPNPEMANDANTEEQPISPPPVVNIPPVQSFNPAQTQPPQEESTSESIDPGNITL